MVCEDINDGIVRLESKKSHLVSLVASLNSVKAEQTDMSSDFDNLIDKLKAKISKTDKQIKELCDYAVEIAKAEADMYESMYQNHDDAYCDSENCYFF